MGFLLSRIFWGGLLIFWGIILILEKVLNTRIPFTRFFFAFLLIYFGVCLILKISNPRKVVINKDFRFENPYRSNSDYEYSVVFGSNVIDLSKTLASENPIIINSVFSSTDLYLSPKVSYKINITTVFGQTNFPHNNTMFNISSDSIIIEGENVAEPINIEINTVFGTTNIVVQDATE